MPKTLLILLVALASTVAADAPVAAHAESGSDRCLTAAPDAPFRCGVYAKTDWTLVGCDADACAVRVDARANGWSKHPGWLVLETVARVDDPGCDGAEVLSLEVQDASCAEVCRTSKVAWTSSCSGGRTFTVALPAGACAGVWVEHRLHNEATASRAVVVFFTDLCRAADGTASFRTT